MQKKHSQKNNQNAIAIDANTDWNKADGEYYFKTSVYSQASEKTASI